MIGKNIIRLSEVDSTNNYARSLLSKDIGDGTVVLAQYQNKGRGHLQNLWESEWGKNLTFSLIFRPEFLNPVKQFALSQVVALGIFDYVKRYANMASIKWPNDIYIGDKKVGGILIENTIMGSRLSASVAGIGINLNQEKFSDWIPNPISLKLLNEDDFDVEESLSELLSDISGWYKKLKSGLLEEINDTYISQMYLLGIFSKFKDKNEYFSGQIEGVDEIGHLVIKKESGELASFQFKEVEYVLTTQQFKPHAGFSNGE